MRKYRFLAILAASLIVLAGCKKSYNPVEKTPEQRAEDYHKYLTTTDLSLFELKGNVLKVVYPDGFLGQYLDGMSAGADTIEFSANGMCSPVFVVNGDSLKPVRNVEGEIMQFAGEKTQVTFVYGEDGKTTLWQGTTEKIQLEFTDGMVSEINKDNGTDKSKASIKVTATDNIGNWTTRQITYPHGKKTVQKREIMYY